MTRNHLKAIAMPKSWPLNRKETKYVMRPRPGAHSLEQGMPISLFIRMLGYAETAREIRKILREKEVLVDGKRVRDPKRVVGLMDLLEFPELKEKFRVVIGTKGKLKLLKTDETVKPCKIIGKRSLRKGKTQLSLHDGRNILLEKPGHSVGEVLMIKLPGQEITETFRLEKGSVAYLVDGNHRGRTGIVEGVEGNKLRVKIGPELVETRKAFAFAIGKGKPAIKIE